MRLVQILLACLCSVILTLLAARLFPLPQTDFFRERLMQAKIDRAIAIGNQPKLVVMAGSNGLFSHRCETFQAMLGLPCVNAGMTVDMGLDYLLQRWKPLLHPGDTIYMPLEGPVYIRTRAQTRVGPENRIMAHEDWSTLRHLPADRQWAAAIDFNLPDAFEYLISPSKRANRRVWEADLPHVLGHDFNPWGDHDHHDRAVSPGNAGALDQTFVAEPTATQIRDGYGTRLTEHFLDWARVHGIAVIGGLPTGFADTPMPVTTIQAIQTIFTDHGADFLMLPNGSRYPRRDFYDTPYHLDRECQIRHSMLVAEKLGPLMHRPVQPAPAWMQNLSCPSLNAVGDHPPQSSAS